MQLPRDRRRHRVVQHDHAIVGVRSLRPRSCGPCGYGAATPAATELHEQLVLHPPLLEPRLKVHRYSHLQLLPMVALHRAGARQLVGRSGELVRPTGGQAVLHDESDIVDDAPQLDALAGYPSTPVLLPSGVAGRSHVAKAESQVEVALLIEQVELALVALRHPRIWLPQASGAQCRGGAREGGGGTSSGQHGATTTRELDVGPVNLAGIRSAQPVPASPRPPREGPS
eukprot:scaffold106432_cov64-Phaeocystis_antarctica.AAC.2